MTDDSRSSSSTLFKETRPEAALTACFSVAAGIVTVAVNQSVGAGIAVFLLTALLFAGLIGAAHHYSRTG